MLRVEFNRRNMRKVRVSRCVGDYSQALGLPAFGINDVRKRGAIHVISIPAIEFTKRWKVCSEFGC
jgi:hypothetical protein